MENKLDLKWALELVEKSGAEKWKVAGFDGDMVGIKGPSGFNQYGPVDGQIVVYGEDVGAFIGESGVICKESIIRALVAEKKVEILTTWMGNEVCPFKAMEKNTYCNGICPECVLENIHPLAIAELKKGGVEID